MSLLRFFPGHHGLSIPLLLAVGVVGAACAEDTTSVTGREDSHSSALRAPVQRQEVTQLMARPSQALAIFGGVLAGALREPSAWIAGTAVAVLVRELLSDDRNGMRKLSLRATDGRVDVSRIAREFGGGGHPQAAGFATALPYAELVEKLRALVREQL